MTVKITSAMRRMVHDSEFREAVAMMIEAQDRFHAIEARRKDHGRPFAIGADADQPTRVKVR